MFWGLLFAFAWSMRLRNARTDIAWRSVGQSGPPGLLGQLVPPGSAPGHHGRSVRKDVLLTRMGSWLRHIGPSVLPGLEPGLNRSCVCTRAVCIRTGCCLQAGGPRPGSEHGATSTFGPVVSQGSVHRRREAWRKPRRLALEDNPWGYISSLWRTALGPEVYMLWVALRREWLGGLLAGHAIAHASFKCTIRFAAFLAGRFLQAMLPREAFGRVDALARPCWMTAVAWCLRLHMGGFVPTFAPTVAALATLCAASLELHSQRWCEVCSTVSTIIVARSMAPTPVVAVLAVSAWVCPSFPVDEDLKACEDILQFMQDHHGLSPKRRRPEKDRAEDMLARAHKRLKDAYADNQMDPQVRLRWEQIVQRDITMTPEDRALQRREEAQIKRE